MDSATAQQPAETSRPAEPLWTVHEGDARHLGDFLRGVAASSGEGLKPFVQTTITSPPYSNLVDYGSNGQIGFGQSYAEYIESCRGVFADVHEWSVDSGSMWLVVDSFLEKQRRGTPSRLVPLPFELAAQAASVGWTLREVIIWRKDRTRPWSHRGKLRNGFEYILFFVKSSEFKFEVDRLRDTDSLQSWWIKYPERHNPWGMTPDNVWEIPIPVQGSWNSSALRHACPFPEELVRRMILLSSDEGDVVLDPFAGSGAVVLGAQMAARKGLGLELSAPYVSSFQDVALPDRPRLTARDSPLSDMTRRLLELRALKYPKELANQLLRSGISAAQISAIVMQVTELNFSPARTGFGSIKCAIVLRGELRELDRLRIGRAAAEVMLRPPLSKYGLEVEYEVISAEQLGGLKLEGELAAYTGGRTWNARATFPASQLAEWLSVNGAQSVIPVLSPLHVQQALESSL